MRNSLLASQATDLGRIRTLIIQIPAHGPLSLLVLPKPTSRSTIKSKESFILSARRLRKPRPKLMRLLPLISLVGPNSSLRSWMCWSCTTTLFWSGFNGLRFEWQRITCVYFLIKFPKHANLRYQVCCVFLGVKALRPCSTALLVPALPFLLPLL